MYNLNIINDQLVVLRNEIRILNKDLLKKEEELVMLMKHQFDMKEENRIYNNQLVVVEVTGRDRDIERFRENYPELVVMAKERDLNR